MNIFMKIKNKDPPLEYNKLSLLKALLRWKKFSAHHKYKLFKGKYHLARILKIIGNSWPKV